MPETFYYTVSNWNTPPLESENHHTPALDIVLGVEKFSAETMYDDDRIIYRDSPFEVKYYHYRRWAAVPRTLVTDEILKQLRASSCCREVVAYPAENQVNYTISGRVLAFEEWDQGEQWFGRVALSIQVYEPVSRRLVWQEVLQAETPVAKKIPAAVVEAIAASLQKCVSDLQKALVAGLPATR
ncbi:MAG: ABC-type transport auxiliary lipoprotein family protein [bacterium]